MAYFLENVNNYFEKNVAFPLCTNLYAKCFPVFVYNNMVHFRISITFVLFFSLCDCCTYVIAAPQNENCFQLFWYIKYEAIFKSNFITLDLANMTEAGAFAGYISIFRN